MSDITRAVLHRECGQSKISTTRIMQLQCWLAVSLDEGQQEEFSHKQTHDDLREAATAEKAQEADESDLLEELVDLPEAVLGFVVVICQHRAVCQKWFRIHL